MLEGQAADRVEELVPIRYGRMLVSPFTFYRGAAGRHGRRSRRDADDRGSTSRPAATPTSRTSAASRAPDRRLVFDINDFDETLPGPWEWDVKRLVTSIEIAGRDREFGRKQRTLAVQAAAMEYREQIRRLARMGSLEAWYERVNLELIRAAVRRRGRRVGEGAVRARTSPRPNGRRRRERSSKLAREVDGSIRIISDPPLITPLERAPRRRGARKLAEGEIRRMYGEYRASLPQGLRKLLDRYRFVDAARKVVGVGSVGTRAWIVLLLGRDDGRPAVPADQGGAALGARAVHRPRASTRRQGRRVVEGQRFMQASGDILLGWMSLTGFDGVRRDFYVRQLWDAKGSARIDLMTPRTMAVYARLCGGVLANAHARSGDRVAIASYLGGGDQFDRAMVEFAVPLRRPERARLRGPARRRRLRPDQGRARGRLSVVHGAGSGCQPGPLNM